MKLTTSDKAILNSYSVLLDGLSDYMGAGYEYVLHNLEDYENSVIKIINGYYSNRSEGAPITDLALKMMKEIEKSEDLTHKYITYFNRNEKGVMTKSTTLPIISLNNRIIGLLCINFYMDTPLSKIVEGFNSTNKYNEVNEKFTNNMDELFLSEIEKARSRILRDSSISTTNKNKEILNILYNKGFFNLKDSVDKASGSLGISKNTVYLHLRSFE